MALFYFSSAWGQSYPQDYFGPPLKNKLILSGTFGELRSNHFHSGIDLKTKGKTGLPVLAIAQGYVSRIKVSPYGFGRALYVVHPNGYTSVYAHLQRFSPEVEEYLKKEQQRRQKNSVNLYPPAGKFNFTKGQTIAYSGNSGGSGGPHLHFEIRDTRTEKIINPLLFGYKIADTRHPSLKSLMVYEFKGEDLVSSQNLKILEKGNGRYVLAGNPLVAVNELPAFGIETFDRQDDAWNKNGVFKIELYLNDELCYNFTMETFAFAETRYINSHIDYGYKNCCQKTVNRLYLQPNNQLSVYQSTPKMKLPQLPVDSSMEVLIRVSDVAENVSELRFTVKRKEILPPVKSAPVDLPLFRYRQSNFFKSKSLELSLPAGAFYQDVFFENRQVNSCAACLSPVEQVGYASTPVHKYFTLKIKAGAQAAQVPKSKLCLVSVKEGAIVDYEGGTYQKGWVSARTRQFGQFALAADTLAPTLQALNFKEGGVVSSAAGLLKLKVYDDLSGVENYQAWVNGNWVRLYFDAKNNQLQLRTDDLPAKPGALTLKIEVSDDKNNKTVQSFKLTRA
jgi:murein DD-endopeptidase MepM/ murein hydrolase activator NlpD